MKLPAKLVLVQPTGPHHSHPQISPPTVIPATVTSQISPHSVISATVTSHISPHSVISATVTSHISPPTLHHQAITDTYHYFTSPFTVCHHTPPTVRHHNAVQHPVKRKCVSLLHSLSLSLSPSLSVCLSLPVKRKCVSLLHSAPALHSDAPGGTRRRACRSGSGR